MPGQGRVCAGAGALLRLERGELWLLLSPRSRSPGAAEGGCARAQQRGRGDVSGLMATHPPRLRGAGPEVSHTARVSEHLRFYPRLFR